MKLGGPTGTSSPGIEPEPESGEQSTGHITSIPPSHAELFIAIGGSTGAREALKHVLSRVPTGAGVSVIVINQIAASSPNLLADTLNTHCHLPVQVTSDGLRPKRDTIYVARAGTVLSMEDGCFRIHPHDGGGVPNEIDGFMASLAHFGRERAVGVLLSGLGSDGVTGLRAIRSNNGWTLVQSPDTALYDAMPEAAIAAGVADRVLPVEEMPAALLRHLASLRSAAGYRWDTESANEIAAALPSIADRLLRVTGHDFGRYKEGTFVRRVQRRMSLAQTDDARSYAALLQQNEHEVERLFKDLLIGVSHFFRDPEAFEALAERVIPRILDAGGDGQPVRIWVPGCSSGEEPYSLAMLVREKLLARGSNQVLQIFATDIDIGMLAHARRGRYGLDIAQHIAPERLDRFTVRDANGYEVDHALRESTIFSVHNLIRDPPFPSLDLISCRNLLIYLKQELQRQLVPLFHYALRPGGFLFLGPSEGLAAHPDLFETIDKRHRIYRRNDAVKPPPIDLPHLRHRVARMRSFVPVETSIGAQQTLGVRTFERMVLEELAPATIAVNRHGDITYVAGRTSRFLQPHPGELSNNLFDHVRRGLRRDIRAALDESVRCFRKVERHGVSTEIEGQMHTVKVTVRPLPSAPPHGALFAVILEETGEVESPPTSVVSSAPDSVVEELETELHSVRAELQCTIEELESANEELRATNEELVSTNEEMQSANEEMQTSREELQSANEELETLNADLEDKAAALASANDYLQNLLAATQIATIFLDRQLRVTKFTPAARSVFRLIEADVGRFLEDLAPKIEGADLLAECRRVLSAGQPVEAQVHTPDGDRWYAVRLLPYRKDDGSIDGVVSTFIDITELKTTEASLRSKEADASRRVEEFDAIFDAMSFPIIVFDAEGHPVRANRLTRALFGIDDEFTDVTRRDQLRQDIGLRTVDGTPLDADERPSARALRGEEVRDVLLRVEDPRRGDRVVEATAIPLRSNDLITGAVLGWRDITEKMAAERALREHQRLLQDIIDESPTHIFIKDTAGRFITINKALERLIGASREQVRGKTEADLRHCGHADSYREQLEAVVTSGRADQREHMVTYPDGSRAAQLVNAFPLRDSDGAVYGVCGITFDITGRKEAEEQRLALERRFLHAQKLESLGVLAGGVAHDFNNLLLAILGNLDLALGDTEPDSELREDIVNAMHAARRAADLAHQMLAFSGKGSFVLTQIDFRRVIQDSADLLRASLSKRIDLDITLADELPLVEADLGQIQQLMLNLIANASDAIGGDAGKVTIQVGSEVLDEATLAANRVSTEVKPGRYVVLGITDTGCGMNRETLDKLFDPFFSTKGPGRGMGMAALLGIVRAHQGAVLVQSGPGAGTRIRIAFQPSEPLRSTSAPPSSSAGAASSRSRPGYVLVVDDEDVVRRVCSRFVERLGFPTLSASDGEEAVEVFRKRHKELSCVILDMSMPRLGGVGALQKMKTIDATVPVILSSGYSEDQLAEVAAKGDLAGFITKPYDMDAFSRVLKEAVKQGTRSS